MFRPGKSIILAAKAIKAEKMASSLSYRVKTALKAFNLRKKRSIYCVFCIIPYHSPIDMVRLIEAEQQP